MTKILICLLLLFVYSCKKEPNDSLEKNYSVEGKSQKGPFLNGSNITVNALDNNLAQTGATFNTQVQSADGSFQINTNLTNALVQLKSEGFFYNEVKNSNSLSPITLYCLTDLSLNTSSNINILTHLERKRVETLVAQGLHFHDAKKQALQEILKIFSIVFPQIHEAQQLNIGNLGDENAILLAISVLMLGHQTDAEFIQFMADISNDLAPDGVLNQSDLGNRLLTHAHMLNLAEIRQNLAQKFTALNYQGVPDFEKYIDTFKTKSNFQVLNTISYPDVGPFGTNVLSDTSLHFNPSQQYSITANLDMGAHVMVRFTSIAVSDAGFNMANIGSWSFNRIDYYSYYVENSNDGLQSCECQFAPSTFVNYGAYDSLRIEIFENHATIPTRTKTILIPY